MSNTNTIILSAGKIDYTRLPIGSHQSNATIPINGKPVVSWILDDLIRKNILEATVVVLAENQKLKEILTNHYHKRMSLNVVELESHGSILNSLAAGLKFVDMNKSTRLILGDTLIYDDYSILEDFVYISNVDNSENWCISVLNEDCYIEDLMDKPSLEGSGFTALCGYYNFLDTNALKNSLDKALKSGKRELSHVLLNYNQLHPLKAKWVQDWFDFGHMESFIASKKALLRPRHFNQLIIHPVLNTITKVSENNEKLSEELSWYLDLPEDLKVLTPRILNREIKEGRVLITQEFYGYPSLSELYVYGDLSVSVWHSILSFLFEIHYLLRKYEVPATTGCCEDIYLHKTYDRINQLKRQSSYWERLWEYSYIYANDIKLRNYNVLLSELTEEIKGLGTINSFTIIHGDYCLPNILYDLNNQIVRLIDPRGSFGNKGIYGDPRYDIAKLRHSVVGNYDLIVGDLFYIDSHENNFNYSIYKNKIINSIAGYFDSLIEKNGYELRQIKLIEGLLFLSMIPYHADYPDRQKMMYLNGLFILNELCE